MPDGIFAEEDIGIDQVVETRSDGNVYRVLRQAGHPRIFHLSSHFHCEDCVSLIRPSYLTGLVRAVFYPLLGWC